jgi:hypothetical protein
VSNGRNFKKYQNTKYISTAGDQIKIPNISPLQEINSKHQNLSPPREISSKYETYLHRRRSNQNTKHISTTGDQLKTSKFISATGNQFEIRNISPSQEIKSKYQIYFHRRRSNQNTKHISTAGDQLKTSKFISATGN